ncbi:MAG: hypothetical protein LBV12_05830 [Puniceicoccales bacterium]|jgi:hypothetical protein|nr:hypothetical protein [Puniceicoccales bacterium]
MYFIKNKSGEEIGPLSAIQIRESLKTRDVGIFTPARQSDESVWKMVGSFSELSSTRYSEPTAGGNIPNPFENKEIPASPPASKSAPIVNVEQSPAVETKPKEEPTPEPVPPKVYEGHMTVDGLFKRVFVDYLGHYGYFTGKGSIQIQGEYATVTGSHVYSLPVRLICIIIGLFTCVGFILSFILFEYILLKRTTRRYRIADLKIAVDEKRGLVAFETNSGKWPDIVVLHCQEWREVASALLPYNKTIEELQAECIKNKRKFVFSIKTWIVWVLTSCLFGVASLFLDPDAKIFAIFASPALMILPSLVLGYLVWYICNRSIKAAKIGFFLMPVFMLIGPTILLIGKVLGFAK